MSQATEKLAQDANLSQEEILAFSTSACSVYAKIENKTSKKMTFVRQEMQHGTMPLKPADEIKAGGTGKFDTANWGGGGGNNANVTYTIRK